MIVRALYIGSFANIHLCSTSSVETFSILKVFSKFSFVLWRNIIESSANKDSLKIDE